jgi:SAM-dependent methyltransferase
MDGTVEGMRGQDANGEAAGSSGVPAEAGRPASTGGSPEPCWWLDYFDDRFVRLYRPLLDPARTLEEVEGITAMLGLPRGARLLDLACGWGRHAVELSRLGYEVWGVDRSMTLLGRARRLAPRRGADPTWVCGDIRELPWREAFDAVVCMFSSLGYFLDDDEDRRALRASCQALRPGGLLLVETMHRDFVAREFAERDWWRGRAGEHIWVEREFDAVAGVSREWLRWRDADGLEGEKYHEIRVRSATEWAALVRSAGLDPEGWFGDWDAEPLTLESPRLILIARRPE